MNKKNKVIACFYIFLAVTLVTVFLYMDSTFVCEKFYTSAKCQQLTHTDQERPIIQFAASKLNEIVIEREYDVGKERLFNVMADVKNYPIVLPRHILSVEIIEQEPNIVLVEEILTEQGIKVKLLARHTMIPYEEQIIEVIDGDARGTKITQTFTGDDLSTKISTKIKLQLKGLLTPIQFFPKSNFGHAMITVNSSFADYAKQFDSPYKKIIDDTYREILLRPADQTAFEYWAPLLENGKKTKVDIENALINSTEKQYLNLTILTDEEIIAKISDENKKNIDDIYREILLRPVEEKALAYWGAILEVGLMDKNGIKKQIQDSPESLQLKLLTDPVVIIKMNMEKSVIKQYYTVFGKNPDKKTLEYYTEVLLSTAMKYQVEGATREQTRAINTDQDLSDEFSSGYEDCVTNEFENDDGELVNEEICTFIHPNPMKIPK